MYFWKMIKTLENPNGLNWDQLVKQCLSSDVHPDRKKSFILSRMALWECLKGLGHSPEVTDLLVGDYSNLKSFPQLTISLSHTKEVGAALVGDRQSFRSLGIDIEHEARPVKDSVAQRIAHPEDEKLRNIEIWCLKEAAFKALMNSGEFPKPVEFSSIHIGHKTWSHSPSGFNGEWELDHIDEMVIARAFLRN